ncbi:MAG TPA: SapC family protein, partial [Sphingomonas sp.]|nr:SapC family protein [Sphingomonas sp.]
MTRPVALDNVAHADLRVALRHGAAYGDAVNQTLVFPTEFAEAQREFPILFRRDG